ncbi:trypsin-like peptidase domain-containing protein [Paenibacillus sp. N1-5-1-14]|uniref:S1C family serine protease n=1 Tax=Paenibacillus radicibacter TaxID=2972488 RepID=UPI002158CF71|nr:trypsin-like peptidase domain-containing protein [Paenibacillus radicibacter]MCR8642973.1 trypsin-like peptidase domain-containing protein [Paenibacillus radicibacter]
MSFFDKDDFYSSKPTRHVRRRGSGQEQQFARSKFSKGSERSFKSSVRRLLGSQGRLVIASAVGGALIMLLLVVLILNLTGSGAGKTVAAVAGPSSGSGDDRVVKVTAAVKPAIVSVITSKPDEKGSGDQGLGMGSGVIFQKNGGKVLVVTNNHVVENGTSYEVMLHTGEKKKATLIGKDRITDLAVLEMDDAGVTAVAEFGDSSKLKMGETVITLGNPLGLGVAPSVTKGIISEPRRTIPVSLSGDNEVDWEMEMIQTDAAINQGNSGGALVNMDGKVIGINTMKIANLNVDNVGFAIPITDAIPIIESLIKDKIVKRPLIGVTMQNLQSFKGTEILKLPEQVKQGIIVLEASGPAKEAGMMSQDVITALDGKPMSSTLDLRKYLYLEKKVGDTINVTFYRGGKEKTAKLTLAVNEAK